MTLHANMDLAAEKCPRCENDRAGNKGETHLGNHTCHAAILYVEVGDTLLENLKIGFLIFPGFPMACLTSMIEPMRAANEISGTTA